MKKLMTLILILLAFQMTGAKKYWVGGGSTTNWNATGETNWSDASGGTNDATVPAIEDSVYFDSGSGNNNCNNPTTTKITRLEVTTDYSGTISGSALGIDGDIIIKENVVWTISQISGTPGIGIMHVLDIHPEFGSLVMMPYGGYDLIHDLRVTGVCSLIGGEFHSNGYTINCSRFSSSGIRTMDLTNSTIRMCYTGGVSAVLTHGNTGLTDNTTWCRWVFTGQNVTSTLKISGSSGGAYQIIKGVIIDSTIVSNTNNGYFLINYNTELDTLCILPGHRLVITGNTTTKVDEIYINGTVDNHTKLGVSTSVNAYLSKSNGNVMMDCVDNGVIAGGYGVSATGGADFKMGFHSRNLNTNSGWYYVKPNKFIGINF